MNNEQQVAKSPGSLKSYIIGFLLSLFLTFAAYIPVIMQQQSHNTMFSQQVLIIFVGFLAVVQLVVQLVFFLHLLHDEKPRWNTVFFISTISIVLIVVIGSIWIMNHLNYNMSPMKMNQFIIQDEGIHK